MNLMMPTHAMESLSTNSTHSPINLARALMGNIRNVGLVSQTQGLLDDFCTQLVTHLRSMETVTVVNEYSGRAFLPLISRLNQEVTPHLLASEHLPSPRGPVHIWVIHEADRLSAEQQAIICRLIAFFPALPLRLVWLSQQALPAWKNHAGPNSTLLDLDALPVPIPPYKAASAPITAHTGAAPRRTTWFHRHMNMASMLTVIALLIAATWMTVFSHSTPPPVPYGHTASVSDATPTKTPAPAASQSTDSDPQQAPQVEQALPEIIRTDARWLTSLPADSLVVEHGSFNTLEQAQKFQAKHKVLGSAHIIALRKTPTTENWQYTVVTGHFRSEERAKRYVSRLEWRSNARIRATDKLKPLVASAP
jgi:hypothetical protein